MHTHTQLQCGTIISKHARQDRSGGAVADDLKLRLRRGKDVDLVGKRGREVYAEKRDRFTHLNHVVVGEEMGAEEERKVAANGAAFGRFNSQRVLNGADVETW